MAMRNSRLESWMTPSLRSFRLKHATHPYACNSAIQRFTDCRLGGGPPGFADGQRSAIVWSDGQQKNASDSSWMQASHASWSSRESSSIRSPIGGPASLLSPRGSPVTGLAWSANTRYVATAGRVTSLRTANGKAPARPTRNSVRSAGLRLRLVIGSHLPSGRSTPSPAGRSACSPPVEVAKRGAGRPREQPRVSRCTSDSSCQLSTRLASLRLPQDHRQGRRRRSAKRWHSDVIHEHARPRLSAYAPRDAQFAMQAVLAWRRPFCGVDQMSDQ